MRVSVRCFASVRELIGVDKLEHTLSEGATLGDLRDMLFDAYPGLRHLGLQFAVNATYAGAETFLHDGDEIACIPPVGGG